MENKFEQKRQPDIKIKELLNVLDSVKFTYGEQIHYNGTDFLLLLDTPEEADPESPAVYFRSTAIDGFDIYLDESLSPEDKRRILFHEILDANLLDQGFSLDEAHDIAKKEEQKIFDKK